MRRSLASPVGAPVAEHRREDHQADDGRRGERIQRPASQAGPPRHRAHPLPTLRPSILPPMKQILVCCLAVSGARSPENSRSEFSGRPRSGRVSHETNAKGSLRPRRLFRGQVGVAGPEAHPAHSVSDAPGRLWGARLRLEQPRQRVLFADAAALGHDGDQELKHRRLPIARFLHEFAFRIAHLGAPTPLHCGIRLRHRRTAWTSMWIRTPRRSASSS